jgi:hypothetical protein
VRTLCDYLSRKLARDVAEEENLDIIIPDDNQLQLDIDSDEAYLEARTRLQKLEWDLDFEKGTIGIEEFPSRHGNTHIIVTLPFPVTPWQRIALQACLGSDPIRELLSCYRIMYDIENPTILFRKKWVNKDEMGGE